MLPFLPGRKKEASVVVEVESSQPSSEPKEINPILLHAADQIVSAIKAGDSQKLAEALKLAFLVCDSEPHEEGPHE